MRQSLHNATPAGLASPSHTSPQKMGTSSSRRAFLITTEDQDPPDLVVSKNEVSQDSSRLVVQSHLQPARLEKQVTSVYYNIYIFTIYGIVFSLKYVQLINFSVTCKALSIDLPLSASPYFVVISMILH